MTEQPQADSVDAAVSAMEEKLFGPAEEEQPQEAEAPEVASEDTEEPTQDDLEEIELDEGETYRVPKKVKEAHLRWKDYTQKTQEVAELRKQATLQMEQAQAQQAFEQAVAGERSELSQVQSELAQFKAIDATALSTDQLIQLQLRIQTLKDKASDLEKGINAKGQQFAQWHINHRQQLHQAGENFLKQNVPNWGNEAKQEAATRLRSIGYTDAELQSLYDPRFVQLAYEAAQFRKLMSSKGQAMERAQKAPPVIKPGSSDPSVQAKVQNMNWHKQMKSAKTDTERKALAEQKMTKFFG